MFRAMLTSMAKTQCCMLSKEMQVPLMSVKQLKKYVKAEYEIFLKFLKHAMDKKHNQSQGNPFSQLLHDGGTLKNRQKFEVRTATTCRRHFAYSGSCGLNNDLNPHVHCG